jgi:hypothetical protein
VTLFLTHPSIHPSIINTSIRTCMHAYWLSLQTFWCLLVLPRVDRLTAAATCYKHQVRLAERKETRT